MHFPELARCKYQLLLKAFGLKCCRSHAISSWFFGNDKTCLNLMWNDAFYILDWWCTFLAWDPLTWKAHTNKGIFTERQSYNNQISKLKACYFAVKLITACFGRDTSLCELGNPSSAPFLSAECICFMSHACVYTWKVAFLNKQQQIKEPVHFSFSLLISACISME